MQTEALIDPPAADIVANLVAKNSVASGEIGNLVPRVEGALAALGHP